MHTTTYLLLLLSVVATIHAAEKKMEKGENPDTSYLLKRNSLCEEGGSETIYFEQECRDAYKSQLASSNTETTGKGRRLVFDGRETYCIDTEEAKDEFYACLGDKLTGVSRIIDNTNSNEPTGCFIQTILADDGRPRLSSDGRELNELVMNYDFESTVPYDDTKVGLCKKYKYDVCLYQDGKKPNEQTCTCGSSNTICTEDDKSVCLSSASTCGCPAGKWFDDSFQWCTT